MPPDISVKHELLATHHSRVAHCRQLVRSNALYGNSEGLRASLLRPTTYMPK
jgi:hypothetical protein